MKFKREILTKIVYATGEIINKKLPILDNFKVSGKDLSENWIFNYKPNQIWEEKRFVGKKRYLIVGFEGLNALGWNDNSKALDNLSMYYTKEEMGEILKKLNEKAKNADKKFKNLWFGILLISNIAVIILLIYFMGKMGIIH